MAMKMFIQLVKGIVTIVIQLLILAPFGMPTQMETVMETAVRL